MRNFQEYCPNNIPTGFDKQVSEHIRDSINDVLSLNKPQIAFLGHFNTLQLTCILRKDTERMITIVFLGLHYEMLDMPWGVCFLLNARTCSEEYKEYEEYELNFELEEK